MTARRLVAEHTCSCGYVARLYEDASDDERAEWAEAVSEHLGCLDAEDEDEDEDTLSQDVPW